MRPRNEIIFFISLIIVNNYGVESVSASDGTFVQIEESGVVTLGNGLFNVSFHSNATAKSLFKNDVDLLDNIDKNLQTWYLDWNGETAYFSPSTVRVLSNSSEEVHVAYIQDSSPGLLYIEFHLVVLANLSGLYQYVKASNPSNETIRLAEFRTVHRFDHKLMPKITNIIRNGETPNLNDRPTIQDTTWQLQDGTYWSKYDFCGYIRATPWYGVYGGGFGAWLISASREYHSAGPLKQELLVHQDSLMLNYFHSTHFGTPSLVTPPGWSKFYGPYLIYINSGSDEEVNLDALRQSGVEQNQWPYSWVDEEAYPLSRGTVTGKITGQTNAMVVVYDSVEEEFDLQTLGYLYYSETAKDGAFTVPNIRPGDYQILAFPLAGQGSDNLARKNITVSAGDSQDVGSLDLPEPTGIKWSIGETNRRADGFHYSDELRNFYWHLLTPKQLTYTIGQSEPSKNWYYAQSGGVWNISYEDKPDNQPRQLRIGIAAATGSLIFNVSTAHLQVEINGLTIGDFEYENDKAIYRDALQSGNFYAEKITIPGANVIDGNNIISLIVLSGGVMYDAISLAVGAN